MFDVETAERREGESGASGRQERWHTDASERSSEAASHEVLQVADALDVAMEVSLTSFENLLRSNNLTTKPASFNYDLRLGAGPRINSSPA